VPPLIEVHMKVDQEIKVFQEHSGVAKWHNEWRVEYADTEGGSYVTIFAGPQAEQRARDYHNALIKGTLDALPGAMIIVPPRRSSADFVVQRLLRSRSPDGARCTTTGTVTASPPHAAIVESPFGRKFVGTISTLQH
jgi:hypothetical protein